MKQLRTEDLTEMDYSSLLLIINIENNLEEEQERMKTLK